jgi:RNA polymerase sigma-70 factor (ECF subfamily)
MFGRDNAPRVRRDPSELSWEKDVRPTTIQSPRPHGPWVWSRLRHCDTPALRLAGGTVRAVAAGMLEPAAPSAVDLAMSRYAGGDDSAFAPLFAELAPRLRAFLRRMTGSVALADDLLQETFLRIHHARGAFCAGKPVIPWVFAIARNCYVSHTRSARAKLDRASTGPSALETLADSNVGGEQQSMARQTALIVERALLSMTAARREAFVLLRYEGMSVSSAAQVIGISDGALKIRAFHAYEIIRRALAETEGVAREVLPQKAETCLTPPARTAERRPLLPRSRPGNEESVASD